MKSKLIQVLKSHYPMLDQGTLEQLISENMISPFQIRLPIVILEQAQNFVKNCFQQRLAPPYLANLQSEIDKRHLVDPKNHSILMSYDFHIDQSGQLKLIEVNTNAAFLALGSHLYQAHQLAFPVKDFELSELRENILNELRLQGKTPSKPQIAIVDEKPQEQRLFVEFLVFQQMFEKWGFSTTIQDIGAPLTGFDFVYNRSTDFYLENPNHKDIREQFLKGQTCLSPNPFEYLMLADKQRMIEWSAQANDLQKFLPECQDVVPEKTEQLWAARKSLFFKPKRAFGSKQSYKGASMSRRVFEEILSQDFIAQTYVAAPEMTFETPQGPQDFKYDLRFYAYESRVQQVMARLYQGQVTNSRTPMGGFAPVIFS